MPYRESWTSSSHESEASDLIKECIKTMPREIKIENAFDDLAQVLETTARRVRTLYRRDGIPVVMAHEFAALRQRCGLFLINQAEKLRKRADALQERGEELTTPRQMVLRLETPCSKNKSKRRSSDASAPLPTDYLLSATG